MRKLSLPLLLQHGTTDFKVKLSILQDTPWMVQLLSVTCLSLAAKVDETETLTILDLQGSESMYLFEAKTILKMELIVLATLRWRMVVKVKPFSIDFVFDSRY